MTADSLPLISTDRFSVVRVSRTLPGENVHAREVIRHPGAVAIIPILQGDRVCLIRNYRISVDRTLIELPAGTLEPPELPEFCARRELREETGYADEQLQKLRQFYVSPGILDEVMYLYVATGLSAGSPSPEAGELIENLVVPWDEALRMVADGRIQDAKTIVGLLSYDGARRGLL